MKTFKGTPNNTHINRTAASCWIIPGVHMIIINAKRISCEVTGITLEQLTSRTRKGNIPIARFIAIKLLSEYTIMTLQNIAGVTFDAKACQKHATALHGIEEINKSIELYRMGIRSKIYDLWSEADKKMSELYQKPNKEFNNEKHILRKNA